MKRSVPRDRLIWELSQEERDAQHYALTGVPRPSLDGPDWRTKFAEWEVASVIALHFKLHADQPEFALSEAVAWMFQASACKIEELIPHIERALGRALTLAEREAGALAA